VALQEQEHLLSRVVVVVVVLRGRLLLVADKRVLVVHCFQRSRDFFWVSGSSCVSCSSSDRPSLATRDDGDCGGGEVASVFCVSLLGRAIGH